MCSFYSAGAWDSNVSLITPRCGPDDLLTSMQLGASHHKATGWHRHVGRTGEPATLVSTCGLSRDFRIVPCKPLASQGTSYRIMTREPGNPAAWATMASGLGAQRSAASPRSVVSFWRWRNGRTTDTIGRTNRPLPVGCLVSRLRRIGQRDEAKEPIPLLSCSRPKSEFETRAWFRLIRCWDDRYVQRTSAYVDVTAIRPSGWCRRLFHTDSAVMGLCSLNGC